MRLTIFSTLLALGWLVCAAPADAATERRVALVIGNSAYKNTTPLKNPANDARDMAKALKQLDFEVIEGFDLDQSEMRNKIRAFSTAIEGADVALFYYAGHGLQVGGNNFLAPVNATLSKEGDLDFETVSLNLVLRQMERERRTNLVFLDACRDNPLARQLARSLTRSSNNVSSGLARVESGIGMLIGYSTSPGDVALDGSGRNSPYTKALLKHIGEPNQDISNMMISVRQDVLADSGGKQVPWENSSLTGQFYFNPKPVQTAAVEPKPEPKPAAAPASEPATQSAVAAAYQATVAIGTCGAYRIFEEQHRGTFYARLAEERLRANCQDEKRAVTVEEADKSAPGEATREEAAKPDAEEAAREAASEPVAGEETKVAAVDPAQQSAEADDDAKPALDGEELVLALQKHLDRVGCDPGPVDGDWGRRSRGALEKFSRLAKLDLATDVPSQTALAALEVRTDRVCPLECGAQFEIRNDRCVKKVCGSGQILTRNGSCIARPQQRAAPVAQQRSAPRRTNRGPVKREADRFWGGEDTRQLCESGREFGSKCFPVR